MAPRANWKGFLRLSLVSCPIALYPASSFSEKVSFNRINRKTGNRLKQQNIDSETGEVVPREDAARGYEIAKSSTSSLRMKNLRLWRSRVLGPSRSISSFLEMRSMSAISTHLTISPPMVRSDKMPLRSFVTQSTK
jgi:non-homologous end joining protein Ku